MGTMSYQTSYKRSSPPFWLLIGAIKTKVFWHQSEARTAATIWNWGLVRHCLRGGGGGGGSYFPYILLNEIQTTFSQLAKRSAKVLPADLCTDHAHSVIVQRS